MQKIMPFLWFDDKAEEAMNYYVSVSRRRTRDNPARRLFEVVGQPPVHGIGTGGILRTQHG